MSGAIAQQIGARTTEVPSSHVTFIFHPKEIAKLIEAAAIALVK